MGVKMIRWLAILLLMPVVSLADTIQIKETAPQVYVVQKGDTLWDISNLYLSKPWLWPELWRNNVHITNPHLIYPGDELRLRFNADGEPVLEIVREAQKQQIKLTPQGKKSVKPASPIPALPWSLIQSYVEKDLVMSEEAYQRLPYLLGNFDGAVRFAADDLVLGQAGRKQHDEYRVVRKQNTLVDTHGNVLGIQVRHVADADTLDADLGDQVLVNIKQSNFEARRGDKLLAAEDSELAPLELQAATDQRGYIIDNLEQHGLLGKFNVVVLDLGQRNVVPGTVMGIYLQGPGIVDGDAPQYEHENNFLRSAFSLGDEVQQPALKVGELVVFRVFEKVSYALITKSDEVIRNGAIVAKP